MPRSKPQQNSMAEGDMLRLLAQLYGSNPIRTEWADSLVVDLKELGVKLSVSTARAYVYGMRRPSAPVCDAMLKIKQQKIGSENPEVPDHIKTEAESLNTKRLIRTIAVDKRFRARDSKYKEIAQAARDAADKLSIYKNAVDAMCFSCVGKGNVCMVVDCPLRPMSPIPLGYGAKKIAEIEKETRND